MLVRHGHYHIDADDGSDRTRLDAGESMFFLRQLEFIDQQAYQVMYPDLMGRSLLPQVAGIPEAAHVYTYRQYDRLGIAKLIANAGDDLNMIEATGAEYSSPIKPVGAAYGYDVFEIQAAAMSNISLDATRGQFARYACDLAVDTSIATGKIQMPNGTPVAIPNLFGLFNQPGTTSFTAGTKIAGGTSWGTLTAPNATGDEVAADLMGIAANLFSATQQLFSKFRIVLPIAQYEYAAQKRLGSVSDMTALQFALKNSPHIEGVYPWWQAPANTMTAFPYNPIVLGYIVNQEWTVTQPQQRNLKWVINTYEKTGGVISRYPVSISYGTGI